MNKAVRERRAWLAERAAVEPRETEEVKRTGPESLAPRLEGEGGEQVALSISLVAQYVLPPPELGGLGTPLGVHTEVPAVRHSNGRGRH